ncbi:MAG: hypothetical protein ACLFQJ_08090, partial [Campylobacterales bacterium]
VGKAEKNIKANKIASLKGQDAGDDFTEALLNGVIWYDIDEEFYYEINTNFVQNINGSYFNSTSANSYFWGLDGEYEPGVKLNTYYNKNGTIAGTDNITTMAWAGLGDLYNTTGQINLTVNGTTTTYNLSMNTTAGNYTTGSANGTFTLCGIDNSSIKFVSEDQTTNKTVQFKSNAINGAESGVVAYVWNSIVSLATRIEDFANNSANISIGSGSANITN